MDSNHGPLESKVATLPTEPQPLPISPLLMANFYTGLLAPCTRF